MGRWAGRGPRQSSSRAHTSLSQWLPSVPTLILHHSQLRLLHSLHLHQLAAVLLSSGEGLTGICSDLASHWAPRIGAQSRARARLGASVHCQSHRRGPGAEGQQTSADLPQEDGERASESLGLSPPLWALRKARDGRERWSDPRRR